MTPLRAWLFAFGFALAGATVHAQGLPRADSAPALDEVRLFTSLAVLASDSMEGRLAGSVGGERARNYLVRELGRIGLQALGKTYAFPFSATSRIPVLRSRQMAVRSRGGATLPATERVYAQISGTNLAGVVRGTLHPDRYIVVSAHYDHLGVRNGAIFHGADDNASGSAAILAIAEWAVAHPLLNSVIFAWFDGEEEGLLGSAAFVDRPPVPLDSIIADVNLDMVSRSVTGELNVIGARHWPVMQPLIDSLAKVSLVTLRQAHEGGSESDDWTHRSDMGPFTDKGIPFVSFDVDESVDYHRPSDVVEHIQPLFYYRSVRTIAEFLRRLDTALDDVARVRQGR